MYKYHHGLLPNVLDMFELNSTIHQYTIHANQTYCMFQVVELNWEKVFFRYKAVIIWNEIHKNVCVDIKISTFKRYLKSYILNNSV